MTEMFSQNNKRDFWEHPWGYMESFFIGTGLLLTGFLIEMFIPSSEEFLISYPYNVVFLGGYIILLFVAYIWFSNVQLIRWLTKVPASISSIVLVTFMVMIMGVVPQIPSSNETITFLGLNHITTHWAFLFMLFLFLTCLGLVTVKRILQFSWSNFGFIVSHLGLFIALVAGILGSGDLQRLSLNVYEGRPSFVAYNDDNHEVELPFAVYLNDFIIEEYNPKLALVDNISGDIAQNNGKNLYLVEKDETYYFQNYEVYLKDYLSDAGKHGEKYFFVNEVGSPPAALVSVRNVDTDSIIEGWISSGSFRSPFEALKISEDYSLVMTIPEPKKFSSNINILTKEGERINTILEVNESFEYKGWDMYQLSYDEKMGKWSDLSVVELVRDPWLPVIYSGIFMMIIGAINMFWLGNKINKED
ncbi:hypothetical protein [Flavicella sp.]|uniref:hypothetical protein n=1 Tax=Flavicella sp. TaxID=2957742 RepID=UPI0030172803